MARVRSFTAAMSTTGAPGIVTPYSPARAARRATRALATIALVGVQPTFTQVPPTARRSMTATVMPAVPRRLARAEAAWPTPMITASNRSVTAGIAVLLVGAGAAVRPGVLL